MNLEVNCTVEPSLSVEFPVEGLTDDDDINSRLLRPEPVGALADVDAGVVQGRLLEPQGLFDRPVPERKRCRIIRPTKHNPYRQLAAYHCPPSALRHSA